MLELGSRFGTDCDILYMHEGTSFCNQFGDWNPTRHMAALMTMLHRRPARAGNNIIVLYKFLDFVSNLSNLYIDLLVWDE